MFHARIADFFLSILVKFNSGEKGDKEKRKSSKGERGRRSRVRAGAGGRLDFGRCPYFVTFWHGGPVQPVREAVRPYKRASRL
jgi:hypothetical protein